MKKFAEITVCAKEALEHRDHAALCDLMDENFANRRRLYGDECLGRKNLQMIDICKKSGAAAKFPGSGGAVLGLCRPAPEDSGTLSTEEAASTRLRQLDAIREALEAE